MHPKTLREAVTIILPELSGRDKLLLRNTKREDLIKFNLSLGSEIRNHCGLWEGNVDLMKVSGESHPDGVTLRIIEAIWDEIQKQ